MSVCTSEMRAISDEPEKIKFVHTYGVGLHSQESEYDVHDPRWQQRQIDDFVEFTVLAEELGFDGVTLTEHHAPLMTCPSPHLLLAAAAVRTTRIRLGTAVTVLPLYHPIRVAEEAGTLDLLSNGRFELGLGRGVPGEEIFAQGRTLDADQSRRGWTEALELLWLALTERDVTFDGEFIKVERPTTIATRPLQDPLPVWLGGTSIETMQLAGRNGWNVMRNFGSNEDHRQAFDVYLEAAAEHGHVRSGANFMVERFVAIGKTDEEVAHNMGRLVNSFGRFLSLYMSGGQRAVPATDGEFLVGQGLAKNRPALLVAGTPGQIIDSLQQLIDETGTRRLLVETFSLAETRLLAEEVLPVIRDRNATVAGPQTTAARDVARS